MNSPSSFLSNKYTKLALAGGALVIGLNSFNDPIAEKRETIIASMNAILLESKVGLQPYEQCDIIIIGEKKGMNVLLVCENTAAHIKEFPQHTGTPFVAEVSNIEVTSNKILNTESGCMIVKGDGMNVMDPPDCGTIENPEIEPKNQITV